MFIILLSASAAFGATTIDNTARASYSVGLLNAVTDSNLVSVPVRTPSTLEYLKYAPLSPFAEMVTVRTTRFKTPGGQLIALPGPVPAGAGGPLNINNQIPLIRADVYHQGEPLFLRLTDYDQNSNSSAEETILLAMSSSCNGENETLSLKETGPDTGVFVGYIQSSRGAAVRKNGRFSVKGDCKIVATYTDAVDGTDTSATVALVDPFGIVFDSASGQPVSGATVTLLDAATGLPAAVFGDDGVSAYPSTVTSGGTATDGNGVVYTFPAGGYRFPMISPGSYRIEVTPPASHRFPSTVPAADLRNLPGGTFAIVEPGSKGENFTINPGPAIHIDLPVDPVLSALYLYKAASKSVVSIGDFLQYKLTLENTTGAAINSVFLDDRLPLGFRYRGGSAKFNGVSAADPSVSGNGRVLTFDLGSLPAGSTVEITYVVEVSAGARIGSATNSAVAVGAGWAFSNTARATVQVREGLFSSRSIIVGRVSVGCGDLDGEKTDGVQGIRIYLEDSTYVVTDKEGMYHFEGLRPGTHVVQLDVITIPEGYELLSCVKNSRFAGTPFSQFVDVQGGTMWRADFHLSPGPGAEEPERGSKVEEPESVGLKGSVGIGLNATLRNSGSDNALAGPSNKFDYSTSIEVGDVPLKDLRLLVMLPEGAEYLQKSSRNGNAFLSDPQITDNALTYRLGDVDARWNGEVSFSADIATKGNASNLITKAILIFNAHGAKNLRTPLVEIAFQRKPRPAGDNTRPISQDKALLEFNVAMPNEEHPAGEEKSGGKKKMPAFGNDWLGIEESGLLWLWPQETYYPPIPSIKVAVKHDPTRKLKLFLNGVEVDPMYLDDMLRSNDGEIVVSTWGGIHLADGDNVLEAVEYDDGGKENYRIRRVIHYSGPPVRAELAPELSRLSADGKTPPVLAVRLTDREGHPAREGVIGEYSIDPPYVPLREKEDLQKDTLTLSKSEKFNYTIGEDGIALIALQPTSRTGEVTARLNLLDGENEIRAWLGPEQREWILVALAEGTVGYNTVSGNMEGLGSSEVADNYYENGRIAFFAKGKVKGKWILTVAYDSDKDGIENNNSLHNTIDPDTYYTLYGDATQQQYEAASARSVYIKIERDRFYALFGDFETALTVTELSRYSRNLNGLKAEMKGDKVDFNFFVSDTNQTFMKDEIRGDGTSGLYSLSRNNIVINSESITIETRDRFRSEVIISSQKLNRHIDYNIEYDAGTVFFKAPVFSRDEDFNPIYIVIDYETLGSMGLSINYGGRGAARVLDDRLEVGATYVHEEKGGGEGNLAGVDATFKLDDKTRVRAEVAVTDTDFDGVESNGMAYLAEVSRWSDSLDGRAYIREQGPQFGLGQQRGTETGTRKVGFDGTYRINEKLSLRAEAFKQYNLSTDADRNMGEAQVRFMEKNYALHVGLRHAEDSFANGDNNISDQITAGGSLRLLKDRMALSLLHDQSLRGNSGSGDFPTRTTIGADYMLSESANVFVSQEFTHGSNVDAEITRVGLKASPWAGGQISSTIEQQRDSGSRVFSVIGLTQTWKVTEKWTLDAGLDRSFTLKERAGNVSLNSNVPAASEGSDFTSVSLGAAYKEEKWSWTARVETHNSQTEDRVGLFTGIYGEVKDGVGLAAGLQVFNSERSSGSDTRNGNLRLSLAYRPKGSAWIVLDRLDFHFDRQDGGGGFNFDSWRIVNNTNANWRINRRAQLSIQYGAKYINETIDDQNYSGYTDLMGLEGRYDVTEKLDIGLRGSVLHSWNTNQFKYSAGLSVGYNFVKNVWVSVGYNFAGFTDKDFSAANFTSRGVFVKFRIKFDQETVKAAVKRVSGQ